MSKTEKKDVLQRLILRLSARERAIFREKMAAEGNRTASHYLDLFNLLKTGKQMSSEQLCTCLKVSSKSRLSTLRSNLLEELLAIRVAGNRDEDINLRLYYWQCQIGILLRHAAFSHAEKRCEKAIRFAERYGKFAQLSELLLLKNNILQNINYKKYQAGNEIFLERIQAVDSFQLILKKINVIYEQVKILSYRTWLPVGKTELSDIADKKQRLDQLASEEGFAKAAGEPVIKLYYHCTLATCLYMMHEKEACAAACNILLKEWQTAPHLIDAYPALFISSVNTTCYNNFYAHDLLLTESQLDRYRSLTERHLTADFYTGIFTLIYFNAVLKIYHKRAQYDKVASLLKKDADAVLAINERLAPPDALSLPTSIYISYFVLEQWDKAEALLLEVKENSRVVGRDDILFFTLIFHLLILYEKKEWYRLDTVLETTYHFLYARRKLRIFEKEMILFIKHLARVRETDHKKTLSIAFLKKLKDMTSGQMPLYSMYFNFPGWIESKIKGLGYMAYTKARIAEHQEGRSEKG